MEEVKISDAPFWCLHFVYSENIAVRNLAYEAINYNNDGIDPGPALVKKYRVE